MRGGDRHGYRWVQDDPPGGALQGGNDDLLADPLWGQDAGTDLVALAEATRFWPLAYDWDFASNDPRLHVRRLSILLAHRTTRASSNGVRRLGEYVAGIRRGSDRTLMSVASDAGIDPVALSLLENGALHTDEMTPALIERLAWSIRTTTDHLWSVARAEMASSTGDAGSPAQRVQTQHNLGAGRSVPAVPTAPRPVNADSTADPDLGNLLAVLSIARGRPELPLAMLGWAGSTINPTGNWSQGAGPGPSGQNASLSTSVLAHVLACSPCTVSMPDGSVLHLAPTIRPDGDRRPGYAAVMIGVRDHAAHPVADLEVRLALRGDTLPGSDPSGATNASGVARVQDVWLPDLIQAARNGLRLPISVVPSRPSSARWSPPQ